MIDNKRIYNKILGKKGYFINNNSLNKVLGIKNKPFKGFKNMSNKQFLSRNPSITILIKDSDGDGRINMFDCYPFDKKRHGVKPNRLMRERIEQLPIYTVEGSPSLTRQKQSKNINKGTKTLKESPREIKQRVYSTFKRYPTLIGDIERSKARGVVFTKGLTERNKPSQTFGYSTEGLAVVRTTDIPRKGLGGIREVAQTVSHELKHVRQRLFTPYEKREGITKGEYYERPEEISARKEEERTFSARPDINIKIAKRKLEKKSRYVKLKAGTNEDYYKREAVEKSIEEEKKIEEEKSSIGFRRLFKNKDEDNENDE